MSPKKQKQIFAAARAQQPIEPAPEFAIVVLRTIRDSRPEPGHASMFESLRLLFPRVAIAALAVTIAAAAVDLWAGADIAAEVASAAEQLLLPIDSL